MSESKNKVVKTNVCHDRILTGVDKEFNFKVLFDPFKEQFHLPASLINISGRLGSLALDGSSAANFN